MSKEDSQETFAPRKDRVSVPGKTIIVYQAKSLSCCLRLDGREQLKWQSSLFQEVNMGKEALIRLIRETVQEGGSIFVGKENVLSKLQNAKEE